MDTATQAALAKVRAALESAPHKHTSELQSYWDWYDKPRLEALGALDVLATKLERTK
jgi:hypothetical protein